jgi:hypothetical protein
MLIAALVGCIILALALGLGLGLGLQPAKKSELAHHSVLALLCPASYGTIDRYMAIGAVLSVLTY